MSLAAPPNIVAALQPALDRAHSLHRRSDLTIVSVICVNHCQWRNTARLVGQLHQSASVSQQQSNVLVVDNGSSATPLVARLASQVRLKRWRRNRGFARAVNAGCRATEGRWCLLLNPDMSVPPGFLDQVCRVAQTLERDRPRVGVVGFRLLNSDGTAQGSCGREPTFAGTLAGLLRGRAKRKCQTIHQTTGPVEVDWVTGCCLLVRRQCLDDLGGFDESFFLYYEDVDFCRRARLAGWQVLYDPSVWAVHHWPLHARAVPAALRVMTRHALLTYSARHWSGWSARLLGGLIWSEACLRRAWAWLTGRADDQQHFARLCRLIALLRAGRYFAARLELLRVARSLPAASAPQDGQR
jgi:N-acetylglucosaminyl-diphospho-decaprenol L-rhamnosyltransferase